MIHKLFTCFLITLLAFGLTINEASAKRFGGGRSFGVQRSKSNLFSPSKAHAAKSYPKKNHFNKWGGMLGGLLIGGLLGSLFMSHGLGSAMISWLILGSLIFFAVTMLRRRMQPNFQTASSAGFSQSNFQPQSNGFDFHNRRASDRPYNFQEDRFLRDAKVMFFRLQTAYDQKHFQDLQTFTAPEVFAEIKMQLDERTETHNHTEITQLEAEMLNVSEDANGWIASVRFTGFIKENNEPLSQLDEIWHFRQFLKGSDWVVGGIQQ